MKTKQNFFISVFNLGSFQAFLAPECVAEWEEEVEDSFRAEGICFMLLVESRAVVLIATLHRLSGGWGVGETAVYNIIKFHKDP